MPESSPPIPARPPLIRRSRSTTQINMAVIAVAYSIFALSLLLQPARWASTPAYHNLLVLMGQHAWGVCFAGVAGTLVLALARYQKRWLTGVALSLGLALTTTWFMAFLIRWATSPNTTPETWVSWAVFDFLLIKALLFRGYEEVRVSARTGGQDG